TAMQQPPTLYDHSHPISLPMFTRLFFFSLSRHHLALHSFPTRRSSDLRSSPRNRPARPVFRPPEKCGRTDRRRGGRRQRRPHFSDRKSTRLNSSHVKISYAVFCLKKKKKKIKLQRNITYNTNFQPSLIL